MTFITMIEKDMNKILDIFLKKYVRKRESRR